MQSKENYSTTDYKAVLATLVENRKQNEAEVESLSQQVDLLQKKKSVLLEELKRKRQLVDQTPDSLIMPNDLVPYFTQGEPADDLIGDAPDLGIESLMKPNQAKESEKRALPPRVLGLAVRADQIYWQNQELLKLVNQDKSA